MKNKVLKVFGAVALTAVIFSGCSKVPQAEIDAANDAIAEAKAAGADVYVSESFFALEDSVDAVMMRLEAEKSGLFKNYANSKEELLAVTQYAQDVKQQSEVRKQEVKVEIQNLVTEIKTLIEANRQLITEAPRGKEGTSALEAIKEELNLLEANLIDLNQKTEGGELLAALSSARTSKDKAASINSELTEVIAKYKANVKTRRT